MNFKKNVNSTQVGLFSELISLWCVNNNGENSLQSIRFETIRKEVFSMWACVVVSLFSFCTNEIESQTLQIKSEYKERKKIIIIRCELAEKNYKWIYIRSASEKGRERKKNGSFAMLRSRLSIFIQQSTSIQKISKINCSFTFSSLSLFFFIQPFAFVK